MSLRDVSNDDLPIFYEHQLDPNATRMAAFPARDWDTHMAHWHKILRDETVVTKAILMGGEVAGTSSVGNKTASGKSDTGSEVTTGARALPRSPSHSSCSLWTRPLYAHVAEHNVGSLRVLEKCGFTVDTEKHEGNAEEVVLLLRS